MPEIKPGRDTTEYQVTQSSNAWSIVEVVLGLLITIGSAVATSFGAETHSGIIVGAVVAVFAIAQNTLVKLGYVKSRRDVKVSGNG